MRPDGGARSLRRDLLRGGSGTFALQIGSALLSVGAAVVFARLLGPEEYGAYAFAMAVVALLVLPSSLGLPTLAVREVAAASVRADWGELRGFVTWALGTVSAVSVVVAALAALVVATLPVGPEAAQEPLLVAALLVPLVALVQLGAALLRGLRAVVFGHMHETVMRPALALLAVGGLALVARESLDAGWAIGTQVAAAAVTLVVAALGVLRRLPAPARTAARVRRPRAWLAAALPMLAIGASQVVTQNTDVVMVGAFEGAESAGIYRVATRGAQAVVFVLLAANIVLQPVIVAMHTAGERERLQRLVTRAARLVAVVALGATLVLVVLGEVILGLLFGDEFEGGATALALLAGGQLVNASVGPAAMLLTMTGYERHTALAVGVGAVVNVVLNVALIPPFGIEGAAVATGTSIVVWNLVLARRCVRFLGVDPTVVGASRWMHEPP